MMCNIEFHILQEMCKHYNVRFSDSTVETVCTRNSINICNIDNCPFAERMQDEN